MEMHWVCFAFPPPLPNTDSSSHVLLRHRDNLTIWKFLLYALFLVHSGFQLASYWFVGVAARVRYQAADRLQRADHVLVHPAEFCGGPEILPLQTRSLVRPRPPTLNPEPSNITLVERADHVLVQPACSAVSWDPPAADLLSHES